MLPALRNGSSLPATWGAPVNRLSDLFDRFFHDDFFTPAASAGWSVLPLSMWEDENHIYVEADVPGLTAESFELSVHDGALVIRGERKCERQNQLYEGRRYGRFEQRVLLPAEVDPDNVEARLANGVLTVTLAKSPASKPRRISVKAE